MRTKLKGGCGGLKDSMAHFNEEMGGEIPTSL